MGYDTQYLCIKVLTNFWDNRNSTYFGRRNPIDSACVDKYCKALLNTHNVPVTDILLERRVRMTQLSRELFDTFGSPLSPGRKDATYASIVQSRSEDLLCEVNRLALSVTPEQLRQQCGDRSAAIGEVELTSHSRQLALNAQYLLVRLREPAVQMSEDTDDGSRGSNSVWRDALTSCLEAITLYIDAVISLSDEAYLCQPISWWAHVTSVVSIAKRLAFIRVDDTKIWGVGFADKLSQLADRFDEAGSTWRQQVKDSATKTGMDVSEEEMNTPSQWENYARKLMLIKSSYEKIYTATGTEGEMMEESDDEAMSVSSRSVESLDGVLPGGWPAA